jgi:hypothetical protein
MNRIKANIRGQLGKCVHIPDVYVEFLVLPIIASIALLTDLVMPLILELEKFFPHW